MESGITQVGDDNEKEIERKKSISVENQLKNVRNEHSKKFHVIKSTLDRSGVEKINNKESDTTEIHDEDPALHKWRNNTTLIIGNSMISGLDEKRMSSNGSVKVRSFPGARIEDMTDYIKPLLKKCPSKVILHIGTNNAVSDNSRMIIDKTLSLKHFIESSLSNSMVIISNIIHRSDNAKSVLTLKNYNNHLKELDIDIIDNSNIHGECLTRKGLHLNNRVSGKLAINMIRKIRSFAKK